MGPVLKVDRHWADWMTFTYAKALDFAAQEALYTLKCKCGDAQWPSRRLFRFMALGRPPLTMLAPAGRAGAKWPLGLAWRTDGHQ